MIVLLKLIMRRVLIAFTMLTLLLLPGCIQVGNCKGRAECYTKTAVYYALMGDKQKAQEWCRGIIKDPDISGTMQDFEYNNCIIEVAKTLGDKNFCANAEEHFNLPQSFPVSNVKEFCEKSVEREELRQQSLLNPREAYKHTCPSAILIFSVLPLSILFMKIYGR